MSVSKIPARQISNDLDDANIKAAAGIATSKLADGADFIKRTGAVAFTGNQSMGSNKITNLADGVSANDAVSKGQLDSVASGIDWKKSVRAVATSNVTLGGEPATVDGVTWVSGDRILLAGQTTASQNGIYVADEGGAWARATDADTSAKVTSGMAVFVEEGAAYADTGWVLTTNSAITLGTTALAFTQFTGLASIIAGQALTKTGNTIDLNLGATSGLTISSDQLFINMSNEFGLEIGSNELKIKPKGGAVTPIGGLNYDETGLYVEDSVRTCKASVRAATTGNITLSGTQTIDTIALSVGDRVLAKNQSTNTQNGIWIVASGGWTRATDADTPGLLRSGSLVYVRQGSTNVGKWFYMTTIDPITVGSSAITWSELGTGSNGTPVDRETPSGTINGSNAVFTLANTPISGSEHVTLWGVEMDAGSGNDYTITGNTITFEAGRIPASGDKLRVSYRY